MIFSLEKKTGGRRRAGRAGKRLNFATAMQESIHAIVLRAVRYSDARQVVDLYTREHGRLAVVAPARKGGQHSRVRAALWRQLNLVEMQLDRRPGKLSWPREPHIYCAYASLPFHPVKAAVALFISELLANALRAEVAEPALYDYVEMSLRWFDGAQRGLGNFHLVFMLRLMRFMGIWPDVTGYRQGAGFDLMAGEWCRGIPQHGHWLKPDEAQWLPLLARMNYRNMHLCRFSQRQRRRMAQVMNDYFRLHLPPFGELRSLDVLAEVFDNER